MPALAACIEVRNGANPDVEVKSLGGFAEMRNEGRITCEPGPFDLRRERKRAGYRELAFL